MPPLRARPWAGDADTAAMRGLVSDRLPIDWPAVRFHPGDVDWWETAEHGRGRAMADVVRLWEDEAGLAAFAWAGPEGGLDLVVRTGLPVGSVAPEAIAWVDAIRPAAPGGDALALLAWARAGEEEAAAYEALGLVAGDPAFHHYTGPIDAVDVTPRPLRPDWAVRPLRDDDVPSRVLCGRAAFNSTMTEERYAFGRSRPTYRQELDTVVVDDEGDVVAFALGWLDAASGVVELEPVGVRPDRHRRGLGGIVCRAAIGRARELGATRVYIGVEAGNPPALALYSSLGLTITVTFVPYRRPSTQP